MDILTEHSLETGELVASLAAFQAKLEPALKEVEGQVGQGRYKYADLAGIWAVIQPNLGTAGLAIVQVIERIDGADHLATTLMHTSGQYIRGRCPIQADGGGRGTAAQQYGSAMTYARRYGLTAMLGIVTEDDDGSAAPKEAPKQSRQAPQGMSKEKQADFVALCLETGEKLGDDLYTDILTQFDLDPESVANVTNRELAKKIATILTTQAAIER